jgi:hypothetical protein
MIGTRPTSSTMMSGMSGAETNERNLPIENCSAARTDNFSSRATWTAAMRAMAPPNTAHSVRNSSEKRTKKTGW